MKKLLLILACISIFAANAQNGFTTYTTNLSITGVVKNQTAFLVDNSNNKWIGFKTLGPGANAGLVKYDNTNWTLYNTASSPALPSNIITALAKDNSSNIWIGTNAGLVKFDGLTFTTYNTLNGLPSNTITCIETVGNQVYVGTRFGLSRFDGVNFTNYTVSNGKVPSDTISCIKAETSNTIWLGGYNRLVKFNINGTFSTTSYNDNLITPNTGTINCIYVDAQNTKWLGTTNVGVLMFSGSGFINANSQYLFFGGTIPDKVLDIAQGLNNGVILKMTKTSTVANSIGLIELAPNNEVFQYFSVTPIYTVTTGDFIENNGSNIIVSQGGNAGPKMYHIFDKNNYITQLGVVNSNNFKTLDINNVRAGIANRGDMHWNVGGNGNALYEVPKGSGKNSNFASALWIGGYDNANQLHGGAQTYRQSGVDFWPGPLDTISGTIDTTTSRNYDKIWKVSYTDINTYITAFNTGSIVATPDMLSWPAHGGGNNAHYLAPFVDHNGDGMYNPNDGDYPKIKGDQTLYFIYNDKLAAHSTSFTPMGIEVQGMAYAYGCPTAVNGKPELTYTTFYDYKIINRSANNYHDVYLSMWSDVDLGYYGDDYIGCNVTDNYGYGYNGDGDDASVAGTPGYGSYMPAQGFAILKGPLANNMDGIDNDNDGIVDELGEDCKLNKFNYFNNSFAGVPLNTTDPVNGQEFYNVMTGRWKDGTPFTCGGNGYVGSINTNWAYSGDLNNAGVNSDQNNICGYWTEVSAGNAPADRRMILSSGPFNLNSGQMQEVEYAFVTSFDSSAAGNNLISLIKLKTDIQKVNAFYNQVNKPNCLQSISVGVTEVLKQNDFILYPNPAKSLISIKSSIEGVVKVDYEIVDVLGKTVIENVNYTNSFVINVSDLNSGIYFLRLKINNSLVVKKFVKE